MLKETMEKAAEYDFVKPVDNEPRTTCVLLVLSFCLTFDLFQRERLSLHVCEGNIVTSTTDIGIYLYPFDDAFVRTFHLLNICQMYFVAGGYCISTLVIMVVRVFVVGCSIDQDY